MPVSPGFLTRIKQSLKVLSKGIGDDLGFATGGSDTSQSAAYSRENMRLWLTGTHVDYARVAGPMWANSAWAACMLWFTRNWLQAPPEAKVLKEGVPQGVIHPLVALLNRPNPFYSWEALATGIAISWFADGNSYILVERDRRGIPTALWYMPHWVIEPARRKGSNEFMTHYNYYGLAGRIIEKSLDEICHLRLGTNPIHPLRGFSPSGPILREVATDVLSTNYGAASLKNRGLIGAVASPKDPMATNFDPDEFQAKWRAKTTGDNVGDILAIDVPIDLQFPDMTPDKMALDKIRQYPEARIAACFGLPAQVVGFIVSEMSKTYANYSEAREAAWEECVLPNGNNMLAQLGNYFLPDYDTDPAIWLGMDISNIRPLQPDKDKLHTRVREDYKAGIIDRWTALIETGRKGLTEDKGVYFTVGGAPLPGEEDDNPNKPNPSKALVSAGAPANWWPPKASVT